MRCPKCGGDGIMEYVGKRVVEQGWTTDKRGTGTKKRYVEIQTYRCNNPRCRYQEEQPREITR